MPVPTQNDHKPSDGRVTLGATEARQGTRGTPVLYVLVTALLLAMLAWGAAEYFGTAIDRETPEDNQQTSVPASEPANENEDIVNNDPVPGEKRETEPALVNPQATGNQ